MSDRIGVSDGEWVGMTEEAARAKANAANIPFQVGSRDGKGFMLTLDFITGRVTASVRGGVVTSVRVEGMGIIETLLGKGSEK